MNQLPMQLHVKHVNFNKSLRYPDGRQFCYSVPGWRENCYTLSRLCFSSSLTKNTWTQRFVHYNHRKSMLLGQQKDPSRFQSATQSINRDHSLAKSRTNLPDLLLLDDDHHPY